MYTSPSFNNYQHDTFVSSIYPSPLASPKIILKPQTSYHVNTSNRYFSKYSHHISLSHLTKLNNSNSLISNKMCSNLSCLKVVFL